MSVIDLSEWIGNHSTLKLLINCVMIEIKSAHNIINKHYTKDARYFKRQDLFVIGVMVKEICDKDFDNKHNSIYNCILGS